MLIPSILACHIYFISNIMEGGLCPLFFRLLAFKGNHSVEKLVWAIKGWILNKEIFIHKSELN